MLPKQMHEPVRGLRDTGGRLAFTHDDDFDLGVREQIAPSVSAGGPNPGAFPECRSQCRGICFHYDAIGAAGKSMLDARRLAHGEEPGPNLAPLGARFEVLPPPLRDVVCSHRLLQGYSIPQRGCAGKAKRTLIASIENAYPRAVLPIDGAYFGNKKYPF